jgi:hypothetical protein
MDQSLEQWKPVVGYEGLYSVSDKGNVRSETRIVPHSRCGIMFCQSKLRKLNCDGNGYLQLTLNKNGVMRMFKVHNLVAAAFLGEAPKGAIICHGPGGRKDNSAANLSYGTYSKNNGEDRVRDGTDTRGSKHGCARLSQDQAMEVYKLRGVESGASLAKRFGIAESTVSAIQLGKLWKHITQPTHNAI